MSCRCFVSRLCFTFSSGFDGFLTARLTGGRGMAAGAAGIRPLRRLWHYSMPFVGERQALSGAAADYWEDKAAGCAFRAAGSASLCPFRLAAAPPLRLTAERCPKSCPTALRPAYFPSRSPFCGRRLAGGGFLAAGLALSALYRFPRIRRTAYYFDAGRLCDWVTEGAPPPCYDTGIHGRAGPAALWCCRPPVFA